MERSFSEALKHRRTYYSITNQSPISDQEIECIVSTVVRHVPSAFNSQSTRVVLLLGESHKKLWKIVKDALKKIVLKRRLCENRGEDRPLICLWIWHCVVL